MIPEDVILFARSAICECQGKWQIAAAHYDRFTAQYRHQKNAPRIMSTISNSGMHFNVLIANFLTGRRWGSSIESNPSTNPADPWLLRTRVPSVDPDQRGRLFGLHTRCSVVLVF